MADRFHIHLVTDRKRTRGDLVPAVRAALRGGVDWVQLRDKTGPARGVFETAGELLPHVRRAGAGLLVNDRVDVALAAGTDGVHLAGKSLPAGEARVLLGEDLVLGLSVHGLGEAREAVAAGVDYVTFGHVYPTASKPGLPPRGVVKLAEIVESVDVPVLAIGGIDAQNVREVVATGCAGVAVVSAIGAAEDAASGARRLRRALDASDLSPRHPFPDPARKSQRGAV